MTKTILMDKYPIFTLEIQKSETSYKTTNEIIEYLKSLIDSHPVAKYIAIFDHFEHTSSMDDGVIADSIIDAKNLVFCFGKLLPSTKILAVRPRSIGVSELKNSFSIDFLEVPNPELQKVTQKWIQSIINIKD